jgi:hypothetical protein
MKSLLFTFAALLLPVSAFAATTPASFLVSEAPLATSSVPGNSYLVGRAVVVTAPTMGDLVAIGGSIVAAGEVREDAFFIGGSVNSRAGVEGDLRAIGGNVSVEEPVTGDVVMAAYKIDTIGHAGGSVFAAGANVSIAGGAAGPVIVYGNNVFLNGDFASDVRVTAGGSVRLGESARIRGNLSYESPEPARLAETAVIEGETIYTNASYLPDAGTSRALAIASIGIFLLVRILGALILAGLLAGLFPRMAQAVVTRLTEGGARRVLLTTLLGFAAIAATPILLLLLALTFVGLGIAFLLAVAYTLLIVLGFMYAGITLGALFVRRFFDRDTILWHDGVLGMLILSLLALVPVVGWIIVLVLMAHTAGTLLTLFFHAAFPGDEAE